MFAQSVRNFLARVILRGVELKMRLLIFLFFLLQFADVFLTHHVISRGGSEINLLAAWFVGYGLLPMIIFKLVLVGFIAWVVAYLYPRCNVNQRHAVLGVYVSLVVWYVFIGIWNFNQAFNIW